MPWDDLFDTFTLTPEHPKECFREIFHSLHPMEVFQQREAGALVVPVFPDSLCESHLELLEVGLGRLGNCHPHATCRAYLSASQAAFVPRMLQMGCEVGLFSEGVVPSELLPILALGDGRSNTTTYTRIDRFWHAADDLARTELLLEGNVGSWRILDTWSSNAGSYWAIQNHGWGTKVVLDARTLLAAFFSQPLRLEGDDQHLVRRFFTEALYPWLADAGYLSILSEVSPPARHWVALDLENVTKRNPDSEARYLPALAAPPDLTGTPTIFHKGFEIPVTGAYSSHQRLGILSKELEDLHHSMRHTLRDFHAFAVAMNVRYSLWAGSLLGLFTCGDFLPWDDDVDILVHPDDFAILEDFWRACPKVPGAHLPYHRSYSEDFVRLAVFGGNCYEFLSSGDDNSRILYKLRAIRGEQCFAFDIGGIDLTTIRFEKGQWLERWMLRQKVPPIEAFDNDVEEVEFGGVRTRAYRRSLVEPYLLEKYYPLEWWKHPSLCGKHD